MLSCIWRLEGSKGSYKVRKIDKIETCWMEKKRQEPREKQEK